jgi:riboflavin biosynthesis pyrimidine reductase
MTHEIRAQHDGICVGIGTALSDNPQLSVRLVSGRSPRPIVVDSHLRTDPSSKLVRDRNRRTILAFVASNDETGCNTAFGRRKQILADAGVSLLPCPDDGTGRVDLLYLFRGRSSLYSGSAKSN